MTLAWVDANTFDESTHRLKTDPKISTTFPDSSTTQVAFHGLVTTETNAKNQTRTITKNSQGQVVSGSVPM